MKVETMGFCCGRKRRGSLRRWHGNDSLTGKMLTGCMALFVGLLLGGCATITPGGESDREKLVAATKEYNSLLRWKELAAACVAFAAEGEKKGCLERASVLGDLQIAGMVTRDIEYGRDGGEATVTAEIEYYLLPSPVLRKLQDRQRWVSTGPPGQREWRITNPLSGVQDAAGRK